MTIAACYLTDEGVILGADSAQTDGTTNLQYNYNQKIFEVGDRGDYAIVIWGLGQLGEASYRRLAAILGDKIKANGNPIPASDVAVIWSDLIWDAFEQMKIQLKPQIDRRNALLASQAQGAQLSQQEQMELFQLENLYAALNGGSCIVGKSLPDRIPHAFEIGFGIDVQKQAPQQIGHGIPMLWGVPNFVLRLFNAIDPALFEDILASGKWNGTEQDLVQLVANKSVRPPANLPLRDAVDFVHSTLQATIKAFKFSGGVPRVCGGPVEIGLITSDRPFRWVCHKSMYQAVEDSMLKEPWPWQQ